MLPRSGRRAQRFPPQRSGFGGRTGDPAAARDLYAALLPVLERVLGPQYPQTLAARRNLDLWTREAKKAK